MFRGKNIVVTALDCTEDEQRRLTAEQDPPASSTYGAVPTDDFTEPPHQHRSQDDSSQALGLGARLYLGVLLIVGLSGLVSHGPGSSLRAPLR